MMEAMDEKKDLEVQRLEKHEAWTIDEAITMVGEYGRFQKLLNFIFCLMAVPSVYQIMIIFFAADTPNWKCANPGAQNSTCNFYDEQPYTNRSRCGAQMNRSDWVWATTEDYSVVTQYNLTCDREWLVEATAAVFFVGWVIGSVVLGWVSDNYGRKLAIFVSTAVILVTVLITPWLPSIYAYLFCRLLVGFFVPGTFQQMIMIMTEMVGGSYRAFAGNIIFVFVTSTMAFCGLKAYYIPHWKILYVVCSAPYFFVLLFYKFVPESLRMLGANGRDEELVATLRRIAKFNGRDIPQEFLIITTKANTDNDFGAAFDLFRPSKFAKTTFCQSLGYVVGGMTFYGLYLASKDIGGSLYRDFTVVTMCEIPFALLAIPLCERIGRKKTVLIFYCIATAACIGLCIAPDQKGEGNVLRILLGMVGKCCCGAGYNTLQVWTMELYPTYIRGSAMGFLQVLTRLGAAFAPIVDMELMKINANAAFMFFAAITAAAVCLLPILKEMKGESMDEISSSSSSSSISSVSEEKESHTDSIGEIELNIKTENETNYAENKLYSEMNKSTSTLQVMGPVDEETSSPVHVIEVEETPYNVDEDGGVVNEMYDADSDIVV